jgi:hypothetical protein
VPKYYAYDSETVPFSAGDAAPALVCIQFQPFATLDDASTRRLVTRAGGALDVVRRLLEDPDVVFVGHNIAYDMAVLCREGLTELVFAAYEAGRVLCTWVYERLGEIAGFSFRKDLSLDSAMKAHGLPPPTHKDTWRLPDGSFSDFASDAAARAAGATKLATDFGRFLHETDIRTEPHRTYALEDCLVGKLFQRQYRRFAADVPLDAVRAFSRTMFWLQLMSVWGLRTEGNLVEAFATDVAQQLAELHAVFTMPAEVAAALARKGRKYEGHVAERARLACVDAGWFLRPDGTCVVDDVLLPYIEQAYQGVPPRTPSKADKFPEGRPQRSALVLAESGDSRLEAFAHFGELTKANSADVPMLRRGLLHPRYGLADTGRTTCSNPNVQNLPGAGLVRQCIQPAEGWALLERDYSGIELCTFAAVAGREVGDWSMADAINQSGDPGYLHAMVGGRLLGISPEELLRRRKAGDPLADDARTRAKNLNFGRIGGLGKNKYKDYVRMASKGKIVLSDEDVAVLWPAWEEAVPAGPKYLKWVGTTELFDGTYEAVIPGSGIKRRGMWYCAAANCRFQGLAAAIMHEAGWRLAKACYLPGGALYGVRPALFVHDAFVLEVRVPDLTEVDRIFDRLLAEAAREVMPEVLTKSEGHAALSLAKRVGKQKVERVEQNGRLIPWTPKAA